MARGRMISKSLSTSRKFAALYDECPTLAEFCQSLYPLIITHADDFGRLHGDTFTIKYQCHPASPRSIDEFDWALKHLHNVGLLVLYSKGDKSFIEISDFDNHQVGLHKRKEKSDLPNPPGNAGKFPELPSSRARAELNLTELNRTKQNRTQDPQTDNKLVREPASKSNGNGSGGGSSKRPIYQSDRFVVFEWQLDNLTRMLGPHADAFDLHAWFDSLTQQSRERGLVIPKRCDEWLTAQTLAEAQRRGLPVATGAPVLGKQSTRILNMLAKIKAEETAHDDIRKLR